VSLVTRRTALIWSTMPGSSRHSLASLHPDLKLGAIELVERPFPGFSKMTFRSARMLQLAN
jgi:hypothetical protein